MRTNHGLAIGLVRFVATALIAFVVRVMPREKPSFVDAGS
jgi:hypothetical protein